MIQCPQLTRAFALAGDRAFVPFSAEFAKLYHKDGRPSSYLNDHNPRAGGEGGGGAGAADQFGGRGEAKRLAEFGNGMRLVRKAGLLPGADGLARTSATSNRERRSPREDMGVSYQTQPRTTSLTALHHPSMTSSSISAPTTPTTTTYTSTYLH